MTTAAVSRGDNLHVRPCVWGAGHGGRRRNGLRANSNRQEALQRRSRDGDGLAHSSGLVKEVSKGIAQGEDIEGLLASGDLLFGNSF